MKAPTYRCGQRVNFKTSMLVDSKTSSESGDIIYPIDSENYLVRLVSNRSFVIVNEQDITTEPEYTQRSNEKIRIVFFGNGDFAIPVLKSLLVAGHEVAAVVTSPNNSKRRDMRVSPTPVREFAQEKSLYTLMPRELDSPKLIKKLRSLEPTLGVVADFKLLPPAVFNIPKWGTMNVHTSLLPQYRGASTVASAIRDGETITGLTTFIINEGIDRGNIINNFAVPILENDNALAVINKLRLAAISMTDDAVQRLAHNVPTIPQEALACEYLFPCYAPKIHRKDCEIKWTDPMRKVYNFIRSLSPLPTAWTTFKPLISSKTFTLKIFGAIPCDMEKGNHTSGHVFSEGKRLFIACRDGILEIISLQKAGGRELTAAEFINGFNGNVRGFCRLR